MSNSELHDKFHQTLIDDLNNERLVLPTLPEVALKVRDTVDDENATAKQVADVVSQDPALAARLIQVANSPLLRGRNPINSVDQAITRMGQSLVKTMVTSMAMEQIFQATSDVTEVRLRGLWEESTQVAAIAHALAKHFTKLKPEQALLGGLIHTIGALPVLTRAEDMPELLDNEEVLDELIGELQDQIGESILKTWHFPEEMIDIVRNHNNYTYDSVDGPSYADVIIAAKVQYNPAIMATVPPEQIKAFGKIGLDLDANVIEMEGAAEDIEAAKGMFG